MFCILLFIFALCCLLSPEKSNVVYIKRDDPRFYDEGNE